LALDLVNDEHYQIENTALLKINQVKPIKKIWILNKSLDLILLF